jgi:PTS system sucrose-specific IIC component
MLSSVGLNTWMPIASAANFAQIGACLAVGLKCKQAKLKTVAVPSSMSAALGITEPAIFGVNFRFMKPFVCGMIGGACGSLFGAIVKIGATAYGVTGIPGYLTINNYGLYTILLLISGGIAFILTWITWKEEVPEPTAEEIQKKEAAEKAEEPAEEVKKPAGMADRLASKKDEDAEMKIYAPIKGNAISYEEIPDETFASGVLGAGIGIEPEEGVVYAPYDGEISSTTETKHAIGITGAGDMELLIHVGVDTVNMKGDGFELFVAEGDQVKKGQKLITFDIEKIKAAGYSPTTAVLLTNSDDYEDFKVVKTGAVNVGDEVMDA